MIKKVVTYFLLLAAGVGGCAGFLIGTAYLNENNSSPVSSGGSDEEIVVIASADTESALNELVVSAAETENSQANAAETAETVYDSTEGGIHTYSFVKDDGSWSEAFEKAKAAGGYLARINSQEEYEYIVSQISAAGLDGVILFQIGGRRESGSSDYYWVDENNSLYGESLNSGDYWTVSSAWMENEPSYQDSYNGSTTTETCLVLYYYQGKWALNDSADDIVGWYPPDAGKVGYIIEYE